MEKKQNFQNNHIYRIIYNLLNKYNILINISIYYIMPQKKAKKENKKVIKTVIKNVKQPILKFNKY